MCASSWTRSMLAIALIFGLVAPTLAAEKKVKNGVSATAEYEKVDLFDAMSKGDIEVKFVPDDSTKATVFFKNKSNKPLSISLPPTFAATPVLKQMGMGGMGMGGMGGMGGGMGGMGGGMGGMGGGMGGMGGGQGMGGGMGGGMMGGMGGGMGGMGGGMGGMGMGGMGGGFMNLGPEKSSKVVVPCVCLEHGKKDPTKAMKYELKPIESFTTDARVVELCRMVGNGEVPDQKSAQAAVWHYTDKLSWEFMASKVGMIHIDRSTEPFFNGTQLSAGMQVASKALSNVQRSKSKSPSEEKKESTGSNYAQPVSTSNPSPIR
jgi:hypothetical protein